MVVHHWRGREPGWARRLAVNAVGALGDRRGDHRRRRLEVHRGRMDPDAGDPAARAAVLVDPPPLPPRRRRAGVPAGHPAARHRAHRRRARPGPDPRRSARVARVREVAPAALPARACTSPSTPPRASRCSTRGTRTASTSRSTSCRRRTGALTRPVLEYVDALDEQVATRRRHRDRPRVRRTPLVGRSCSTTRARSS